MTPLPTPSTTYAVVVPVYRPRLTDDEQLSLRHLEHYLPEAEKILVMPETLDFRRRDYRPVRFAPAFFDGIAGYNRLMLSVDFYRRLEAYEYILIYQLDALVLSSDIQRFLAWRVDYLGAPLVEYDQNQAPFFLPARNGGLSLRRIEAFQQFLTSRVLRIDARAYYAKYYAGRHPVLRAVGLLRAGLKGLRVRNSIRDVIRTYFRNEDLFICREAEKYCPGFSVGTVSQALEFAFEREPRFCYSSNQCRLPFGAHAWARYDRTFWEPYLLSG